MFYLTMEVNHDTIPYDQRSLDSKFMLSYISDMVKLYLIGWL